MAETFDVIIVGARCAGASLAALLARRGVRVVVVEQATFPRDTLSSHFFQARALAFVDQLGVTDQIRATGAPFLDRFDVRVEDLEYAMPIPRRPGDTGGGVSVRRALLDSILAQAAADAGADLRMGTRVQQLVDERGRVTGVRVTRHGSESTLRARLVVGADGRNSTIARLAGARKYNLTRSERFTYWSFFEGADRGPDPAFILHRWGNRIVFGFPADSGLYQVVVIPDLDELPRFRKDLEGSFSEYARSCQPVAQALAGARRVGKFLGALRWQGFFREPVGRGWVLVGDAGHVKDLTSGQGIQDAFGQADALAPAIANSLDRSAAELDRALLAWGRSRDSDAAEYHWLASDLGKAGRVPAVLPEIFHQLLAQGKIDIASDLFTHRSRPSQVLTPQRLLGATGRLLMRPESDRRGLLREVGTLVGEDLRRKRLNRRPAYAEVGSSD